MKVIVVWSSSGDTISALGWNGGRGPVRVFEKNKFDPRLGKLPYFATPQRALAFMVAHLGTEGACQISFAVARALGCLTQAELAAGEAASSP